MYQSYKAKDKTSKAESDPHEKSSEDSADKFKDPFAALDQALSGIFVSLGRGLGQTMKDVADVIKDGAVATWQGVSNFGEKTGNWFMGDGFNTDEEIASYKRIQEAIKNGTALEDGSLDYYERMAEIDPDSMTSEDIRNLYYARAEAQRGVKPELVMVACGVKGTNNYQPDDVVSERYGPTHGTAGKAVGAWGIISDSFDGIEMVNSANYEMYQREQTVTESVIDSIQNLFFHGEYDISPQDLINKVKNSRLPGNVNGQDYGLQPGSTVGEAINGKYDGGLNQHLNNLVNNFYSGEKDLNNYSEQTRGGWFEGIFGTRGIPRTGYSAITDNQLERLKILQRIRNNQRYKSGL